MESQQVLQLQVRVDLGVITIKGYSTLTRAPKVDLNHQMQFNVTSRTPSVLWGRRSHIPLQGYSVF